MILINGEHRDQLSITDRGFQYGDGLFETIAVIDGHPIFWDQHWDRLQSGCRRLNI
jgi:4-amino-4-deoxychorismate lyase